MVDLQSVELRIDAKDTGERRILGPISLSLGAACTAIVGDNGVGKSTLLKVIHGLITPSHGRVSAPPIHEQSFVFQFPIIIRRTVAQNLALALRLRGAKGITDLVTGAAQEAGLGNKLDMDAEKLSGGEKQKLSLARALITKPRLLLLDEPTANLDQNATEAVEALLKRALEAGTQVIFATHSVAQVHRLAHEVVLLEAGQVAATMPSGAYDENAPRDVKP